MDHSGYATLGEEITAAYFTEHGVPFRFEPPWCEVFDTDVTDNPDFLVDPDGARAVVEVEQFETTRIWDRLRTPQRLRVPGRRDVVLAVDDAPEAQEGPTDGLEHAPEP